MATFQASLSSSPFCSRFSSSSSSSSSASRKIIKATLYTPNVSVSKLVSRDLTRTNGLQTLKIEDNRVKDSSEQISSHSKVLQELYAIMNIVADREEMHKNIGAQRDNWNSLLLNSVNGMTLTAATMVAFAAVSGGGAPLLALKLSSTLLYMAATGILFVMSKIQPSQLAEEQRNASRLFKKLHDDIKTSLLLRNPTSADVNDAIQKVLALDKAYPLPLLGTMLDKFPSAVQPAVWWPQVKPNNERLSKKGEITKGWNRELEEEMREIIGVLKRKDSEEYVRLSKVALKINKTLAICGPLFTGIAAFGSALMDCGSFAAVLGVMCGAMAIVVNTLEHGGQVGMVFEMYRSSAGFFRLMEETIESTLNEGEVDTREDGELFEVKVALELGRSLSELRDLATRKNAKEEFASKLF